jgi:hypothetical protein
MNFMRDDEFLLLMSFNETEIINKCHVFTTAERVKLRKAGIKTTIEYPRWYAIEPSKGNYDFSSIETMLQRNREADLKTIFLVYGSSLPQWMPDDWFIKRDTGEVRKEVLSMWNEEAQAHADKYYDTLFSTFAAPDVMFIFGEYMEGEAILPCEPCYFDRAALEDYKRRFGSSAMPNISNSETKDWLRMVTIHYNLKRQKEFLKQHNEIWNMQQWLLNQWSPNTINYAQTQI